MEKKLERQLKLLRKFFVGVKFDSDVEVLRYARAQLKDLVRSERNLLTTLGKIAHHARSPRTQ